MVTYLTFFLSFCLNPVSHWLCEDIIIIKNKCFSLFTFCHWMMNKTRGSRDTHKAIGLHILITQCNYHFRCISITITINYHYHTIYPFSSANNKVGEREIDTRLHLLQFSMSTSCVLIHSFHFVVFFSSVSLQWKGTVPLPTHSQLLRERE